jgi:outer membrane protein assembly factor BamD (BamD/ComL family)
MSITGILSSNLFAAGAAQNTQPSERGEGGSSKFQQLKTEFQQLGQDLQSGNLTQAQKDYATISQNLPGLSQAQNSANPVVQAFNQLGQDLQSGNLQAAQSDYTNVQQNAAQAHGHHHHHHRAEESQQSGANPLASPINQAFSQLAQSLQAGNLSGAQSAFATLQNDLQQIGGFVPPFVSGASGTGSGASAPSSSSSLSVSA